MNTEFQPFVFGHSVTQDLLDELGHANYNALKGVLENARHRLCKHLGFGRKTLREKLGLGLFMRRDSYEYHKSLKLNDWMIFIPQIECKGVGMTITLKIIKMDDGGITLVHTAIYEMVMVRLGNEKPTRIPRPILRSIERWKAEQTILMDPVPRRPKSVIQI